MPRPSDKDLKDLTWLLKRLQTSEDWCRPYFERAKRHYQLYRFGSAVGESDWPYINRVRSRDILAFIEDSTAILVQTLFATMPFFSVLPRETDLQYQAYEGIDPYEVGEQIAKALDYQISHEKTEFFEEIVDFFKGGMIFGNAYMGVYPSFENGRYLRPLLKATDFWDVLPIAGAKRVSKARGLFIRDFQSIDYVKELGRNKVFKNVDQLKTPESSGSDPEKNWRNGRRIRDARDPGPGRRFRGHPDLFGRPGGGSQAEPHGQLHRLRAGCGFLRAQRPALHRL